MRKKVTTHTIKAKLWLYPGETANWHFLTVPKTLSTTLKTQYEKQKRGWGSLPIEARIGKTSFKTSLFPDGKTGTYLLPIKASVRRAEGLFEGDAITLSFTIDAKR